MKRFTEYLKNDEATQVFARRLAFYCQPPLLITLSGDLGTGKTTMVRAFLRSLGIEGPIKSPTYSLVEPYQHKQLLLYHVDLYRLSDPEELELIGWRDYFAEDGIWLIEWPEKAQGMLPQVDLSCQLSISGEGRQLEIEPGSEKGGKIISELHKQNK